jgi:hypothetical protein
MIKILNSFQPKQYAYLQQLIEWYSVVDGKGVHEVKVKWLRGLARKGIYTDHNKRMLNKMVKQYNERN